MSEPVTIGATIAAVVTTVMVKDWIVGKWSKKSNGDSKARAVCLLHEQLEDNRKELWVEIGHLREDMTEIKAGVRVLKDRSDRAINAHGHNE